MPIRFPIASLFPILGAFLAFAFVHKKNIILFSGLSFLLIFTYGYFFYPHLLYKKGQANGPNVRYTNKLFEVPLISIKGDTVLLRDTLNAEINLIEFFFVGCIPCEEKLVAIDSLLRSYKRSQFNVVNICSGHHTSFEKFKKYTSKKDKSEFIYLYAPDSTLGKLYGHEWGFPFEQVITKNRIFISKQIGYDPSYEKLYIKNKIKQIEKYAKDH